MANRAGWVAGARRLCLLAAAVCLVAASCSADPRDGRDGEVGASSAGPQRPYDAVVAQTEALNGPARIAKLRDLAGAESGRLSIYTVDNNVTIAGLEKAFEAAYGLDVDFFRNETEGLMQRLTNERAAGSPTADLISIDGVSAGLLAREGAMERLSSPRPELIPGSVQPSWVAFSVSSLVAAWNPNLVPAGTAPRSWEDLADPRWKGKLAMEVTDWLWYATLRDYWIGEGRKSPAEADRLFDAMVANSLVVRGHTLMGQLLISGEVSVAASQFLSIVEGNIAAGAPVAWQPAVQPIISRPQAIGVIKDSPRPATALLFLEWLLGPGQDELLKVTKEPTRADLARSAGRRVLADVNPLVDTANEWTDRYERVTSAGKRR